jgi:hypothetical protein
VNLIAPPYSETLTDVHVRSCGIRKHIRLAGKLGNPTGLSRRRVELKPTQSNVSSPCTYSKMLRSFSEKVTEQLVEAEAVTGSSASAIAKQNAISLISPPYRVMTIL